MKLNFSIALLIGAPKFVSQPQDTVVVQDTSVRFECTIDAVPKPKVSWLLNGKELTAKDNVKFESNAQTQTNALVIPKVSAAHLGTITIKASNQVGEVEFSFKMDVLGMLQYEFLS